MVEDILAARVKELVEALKVAQKAMEAVFYYNHFTKEIH